MPSLPFFESTDGFLERFGRLAAELYQQADGARWRLSQQTFADALKRSAAKKFGTPAASPGAIEIEEYLRSLHLEDLALACACGDGVDEAWEFFMEHFRDDLRSAARAILRVSGGADARANELADSLYAELYGLRGGASGTRGSLFDYFHGRSKLSTWLRAILAQKSVDLVRMNSRMVSLDAEDGDAGAVLPRPAGASADPAPDPGRERYLRRFEAALSEAFDHLAPRERLILACYYNDRMTLAEIGKVLREHESTISRQLERTRRALRESVSAALQRELSARDGAASDPGLDTAQVELAFQYALGDWAFDLTKALSAKKPEQNPERKDV